MGESGMEGCRAPGLVIFDCDGVLVDSEIVAARVMAQELSAVGFPITPEGCVSRYTGISMPAVLAKIEEEWGRAPPPGFVERVRARDADAFRRELRAIDGAAAMLRALTMARCVASSGHLAKMRLTLGITGLLPLLEPHLFSAEQVARGKPAPDLFLFAAARMGVDPGRCVVVEDSLAGVAAAVAAGMHPLGFAGGGHCAPGHTDALRAAGATLVFGRMADLPGILAAAG